MDEPPETLRALPLLTLLLASAAAQPAPAGERVLGEWLAAQRAARAEAPPLRYREVATRTVDGPGQRHTVYTESRVVQRGGDVARRVEYAEADGRPVAPARLARMERRRAHALGAGGAWTHPGALDVLAELTAAGPARATLHGGRPALEVPLAADPRGGPRRRFDRGTLWFERGPVLRLLAARFERRLPSGGRAALDAEFTRVAGLDLPVRHTADADVRQRRRTRWFAVLVRTEVEYSGWEFRR